MHTSSHTLYEIWQSKWPEQIVSALAGGRWLVCSGLRNVNLWLQVPVEPRPDGRVHRRRLAVTEACLYVQLQVFRATRCVIRLCATDDAVQLTVPDVLWAGVAAGSPLAHCVHRGLRPRNMQAWLWARKGASGPCIDCRSRRRLVAPPRGREFLDSKASGKRGGTPLLRLTHLPGGLNGGQHAGHVAARVQLAVRYQQRSRRDARQRLRRVVQLQHACGAQTRWSVL